MQDVNQLHPQDQLVTIQLEIVRVDVLSLQHMDLSVLNNVLQQNINVQEIAILKQENAQHVSVDSMV